MGGTIHLPLSQQLVILAKAETRDGSLAPIGRRSEVIRSLEQFNTAPEAPGKDVLYGPGIRIELPPGDPVAQMLLTVVEDEIAWEVIMRVGRALQWRLLDPGTGRELRL